MAEPEKPLAFTADFPAATRDAWRKLVEGVLKGAPLERLDSTTYDGLRIDPLPQRRPGMRPIAARTGEMPWQILARIDQPDPALANSAARQELDNGATGLSLVFAGALGDRGFGLPAHEQTLARVLEGIDIAGAAIELDVSPQAEAAVDAALAKNLTLFRCAKELRIGHDPLGAMAFAGSTSRHWTEVAPHFARRLAALLRDGWQKLAAADGRVIHNAGGSEAQELAFAVATALSYLRALEAAGLPLEQARGLIFFRLTADADQFLTIAKFRALRKLWTRIETACGLSPVPAFVTAETAWRMMTQRDPHMNMLRTTIAVFAAAVGGANAISVLPFTAALGLPDEFARRNARNIQLVLRDESNLAKVADAAAGSATVEDLTDQLCAAAWTLFREIEAAGGCAAALESGMIQSKVAAVRIKRQAAIASGEDALTGASIFPALDEMQVAVVERMPHRTPAPNRPADISFPPLLPIRLAEPFEALRDASDEILRTSGTRPKIFLACLGTEAEFTPRAGFAANFFAAGGIEAVGGLAGASALDAAFAASGARLACLCAPDQTYESDGAKAAAALKTAGAQHIYLAGRPTALEAALRSAGVQSFIYQGCDALSLLQAAHDLLDNHRSRKLQRP
jgi:methylmalonyl-CoA mutase